MKRRHVIGTLGAATALHGVSGVREQFIGVWKLISSVRTSKDGTIDYPFGEHPVGRITYDKAGRMSAQLMRPGRHSSLPSGIDLAGGGKVSEEELREAVKGYVSYFGTFDVDEAAHTVIHHVQACLTPSWVGTDLRRSYRFAGNRLILSATALSTNVLTWEREPD